MRCYEQSVSWDQDGACDAVAVQVRLGGEGGAARGGLIEAEVSSSRTFLAACRSRLPELPDWISIQIFSIPQVVERGLSILSLGARTRPRDLPPAGPTAGPRDIQQATSA